MKNLNISFTLLMSFILFVFLFSACKKGENILGAGYGRITASSTFSGAATPLLLQIDGTTMDTLSIQRPNTKGTGILLTPGKKNYKLVKLQGGAVLYENTFNIEAGKTTVTPRFLYDGTAALFDDQTSKPAKDSMLVRFIDQVATFPNVIDITIRLNNTSGTVNLLIKSIKGVGKDKFGDFIQLPNMSQIITIPVGQTFRYIITATDPSNNNAVLLSFESGKYASITGVGSVGTFTANGVLSIGLLPPSRGNVYRATNIFERIATQ